MEYFVYLTNDCNLHCQYCSVLLDCKKNNIPMVPNYANSTLALFIDQTQQRIHEREVSIYFFGGEPTIEYSAIETLVCDLLQSLGSKYSLKFILHTNGLLLDQIPKSILNELTLIVFSINYEKIPKYNLADSYFSTIANNALSTKQCRNIPMIARLTITEKTSLYTEIMLVSNFFDYVYWQIENCEQFNDFSTFYATYTYEIERTFDYWFQYLRNGFVIKLVPFIAILKFLFYPDRDDNRFSCGYRSGMVYIQTDGNCYACSDNVESGAHYIGCLDSGVVFNEIPLDQLRCSKCTYRRLCMGRCGRMHIDFSSQHVSEYCKLNQFMFDLFAKNKAEIETILRSYPSIRNETDSWILEYTEFTP